MNLYALISFLKNIPAKIFGEHLNDIQYKTEKTIDREESPSMDEGELEVEFSKVDEFGIIQDDNVGVETESIQEEISGISEDKKEYTFFDCPDLSGDFSVTGIRNGSVHVLCEDEIGTTNNLIINNLFDVKGNPVVRGIVVRKPKRDSHNQQQYELRGYIDLTEYIGVNARALMALEDIIQESVKVIKAGGNKVPEEVAMMIRGAE